MRSAVIVTGFVASLVLTSCGSGGARQDAKEPKGRFPVAVDSASFPSAQTLSQHTRLTIAVRNSGNKTIPDIAVTICNITCTYPASTAQGSAQAFAQDLNVKYLANPSRPIWVVDQPPGPSGYSTNNGGQGAGVTAYSNTWALGPLKPGKTAHFDWKVTAVSPGRHVVAWEVAAGLNGRARAVVSGGGLPHGTFAVDISSKPARNYVNNSGQIINGSGQP
jgi:hypothetical protein